MPGLQSIWWVTLMGGALIGLAAAIFWLLTGRIAGVSDLAGGMVKGRPGDRLWRALFLLGLVGGGKLMSLLLPSAFESVPLAPVSTVVAGLLVGTGTALANGCTSGHGVCGISRLSPRSLVATGTFMSAGALAVYLVHNLRGALP